MVAASPNPIHNEKIEAIELPIIDLSAERSQVRNLIVKACEDYGFFKVINHGVPQDIVAKLEEQSLSFFAKTMAEKQRAGPAIPLGYGCKTIGFNGDMGEVEYLLFNTNPISIAQRSKTISNEPTKFRYINYLFLYIFFLLVLFACLSFMLFYLLGFFILYDEGTFWPEYIK